MQIVTSAVRIDVALTLSKSSLFAPRILCAAEACSAARDDGFQWLDTSGSSSCATPLIVTNRSRDRSVGERPTEVPKVSSSALAS